MTYNKIFKTSILVSLSTFLLVGCSSKNSENVIVSMKKESVTKDEFLKEINFDRAMYKLTYGKDMPIEEVKESSQSMADYLATTDVLYLEGLKTKVSIPEKEINENYEKMKMSLEENDTLKATLDKLGYNEQFIKTALKKSLIASKYYSNLAQSISISENDVKKYYEENKDSLFSSDFVEASHILIKTTDANNKPLSDEKKSEAKKKAEDILKQLNNGGNFAELAKKYSEDTSKDAGGNLGSFTRGQMVKPFEDAAFSLKKNELSSIVETQYGYHIIKVTDKGTKVQNYDEATFSAKQMYLESLVKDEVAKLKKEYKVKINEDALESTIKNLKAIKLDNSTDTKKQANSETAK